MQEGRLWRLGEGYSGSSDRQTATIAQAIKGGTIFIDLIIVTLICASVMKLNTASGLSCIVQPVSGSDTKYSSVKY